MRQITHLYVVSVFQIKLADFGFARHFKDEGMKHIDMTSLAGTPVFMVSVCMHTACMELQLVNIIGISISKPSLNSKSH